MNVVCRCVTCWSMGSIEKSTPSKNLTLILFNLKVLQVFSSRTCIKLLAVKNPIIQNYHWFNGTAIEQGFILYMPTVNCKDYE